MLDEIIKVFHQKTYNKYSVDYLYRIYLLIHYIYILLSLVIIPIFVYKVLKYGLSERNKLLLFIVSFIIIILSYCICSHIKSSCVRYISTFDKKLIDKYNYVCDIIINIYHEDILSRDRKINKKNYKSLVYLNSIIEFVNIGFINSVYAKDVDEDEVFELSQKFYIAQKNIVNLATLLKYS